MMTSKRHARRNAAVARRWFSTLDRRWQRCSDVGNQMRSGMRTGRLNRASDQPTAPASSLVIDDLWSRPTRSTATASSLAVKSP